MSEAAIAVWPRFPISNLADIDIGGTPSRVIPKFWAHKPDGHPWISIADLKCKYVEDTKEYITSSGVKSSNVKLIPPHTTVMSFKLTVGRTAITTRGMYCNEAIAIFRPKDGRLNGRWLYHALPGIAGGVVTDTAVKGATLNKGKLAGMPIPLPPPVEQGKIAEILDIADAAINDAEAVITKLKAIKQGLLHDLLTRGIDANGELRPPRAEAPHLYKRSLLGSIPKDWGDALLDDIAVRGSGHTPSKSVASYWNGGIKWVSLADSHRLDNIYIQETEKEISALGIANSSAVVHPSGTVVLSRDAGVGKSAVIACDMAVSQHFIAWRCGARLNNLFLYFYLQQLKPRFEAIALGSTIKTIGLPFFKSFRVGLPLLEEQDRTAAILLNAERTLAMYSADAKKLRELKAGLADDLLTGRVRVTPLTQSEQ